MKLWRLLVNNWKQLVSSILLGALIALWIMPLIFDRKFIKRKLLDDTLDLNFYIISIIALFLLTVLYRYLLHFYRRYYKNYSLSEVRFTSADWMASIFLSTLLVILFIRDEKLLPTSIISKVFEILLYVYSLLFLSLMLFIIFKVRKETPSSQARLYEDSRVFHDETIENDAEDILNRIQFVASLYKQIVSYPYREPYVFGLHGKWGEGKTSVLNLVANRLRNDNGVILYVFNPWYYATEEALIRNFYDGLFDTLNNHYYYPSLRTLFRKYGYILSAGLRASGINIGPIIGHESLLEMKKFIENDLPPEYRSRC